MKSLGTLAAIHVPAVTDVYIRAVLNLTIVWCRICRLQYLHMHINMHASRTAMYCLPVLPTPPSISTIQFTDLKYRIDGKVCAALLPFV